MGVIISCMASLCSLESVFIGPGPVDEFIAVDVGTTTVTEPEVSKVGSGKGGDGDIKAAVSEGLEHGCSTSHGAEYVEP